MFYKFLAPYAIWGRFKLLFYNKFETFKQANERMYLQNYGDQYYIHFYLTFLPENYTINIYWKKQKGGINNKFILSYTFYILDV